MNPEKFSIEDALRILAILWLSCDGLKRMSAEEASACALHAKVQRGRIELPTLLSEAACSSTELTGHAATGPTGRMHRDDPRSRTSKGTPTQIARDGN